MPPGTSAHGCQHATRYLCERVSARVRTHAPGLERATDERRKRDARRCRQDGIKEDEAGEADQDGDHEATAGAVPWPRPFSTMR